MTYEYTLSKNQKNDVFRILQKIGLETAHFLWTKEESNISYTDENGVPAIIEGRTAPTLVYQNSEFYFQFDFFNGKHCCTFSPGENQAVEYIENSFWRMIKFCVVKWVENIKRDIEEPDLWTEMEKYRTTLPLLPGEQLVNEPIPAYEVEEIASKLDLLADKIEKQFEPTKEQNQFVRSRLNYLADAAKRQPRRDWENIFIAVIINIAFDLALEPAKAQQFWQLVKSIIGPFIHLIGS